MDRKLPPVYGSPFYNFYEKDETMTLTFEQWMKKVDGILASRLCGMSSGDLPDRMYRDAYDGEITPEEYVNEEFGDGDDYDMMYQAIFG